MATKLSPTVLYVDDDADSRELISTYLGLSGCDCNVVTAGSAGEALGLIKDSSYQLFILDSLLPDKSGIALCRQIRSIDGNAPVIFFSAMNQFRYRKAAYNAGAEEYLIKPNDLDILPSTVNRLLAARESARAA
jgi:DNA-binding response OmpR family regulator